MIDDTCCWRVRAATRLGAIAAGGGELKKMNKIGLVGEFKWLIVPPLPEAIRLKSCALN
jgi:hypothetical protein